MTPGSGTSGTGVPATPAPRPVSYLTPRGLRVGLARSGAARPRRQAPDPAAGRRQVAERLRDPVERRHQPRLHQPRSDVRELGDVFRRAARARVSDQADALGALLTQMHRRFHVPLSPIDYAVVSSPSGEAPQWVIFVKNASHQGYLAPLGGGTIKPI